MRSYRLACIDKQVKAARCTALRTATPPIPLEKPVSPEDLAATLFTAQGRLVVGGHALSL